MHPEELIAALLEDSLSDDDFIQCVTSLVVNPPAFDDLIDSIVLDDLLSQYVEVTRDEVRARRLDTYVLGATEAAAVCKQDAGPNSESSSARRRGHRIQWGILAIVSASIAILAFGWIELPFHGPTAHSPIAWVEDAHPIREFQVGDRVRQRSGRTVLRFNNGVSVVLLGEADLELNSLMTVRLHSGQLQADVGERGRGFRVLTQSTDVVDLGTVFGVGVKPTGETDVVVFEGEVELPGTDERIAAAAPQRFTTGEAVRVQSRGVTRRIQAIWQTADGGKWSTHARGAGYPVVTSVHDNLSETARPKYYSIIPHGFVEGARCYVDRPYTWSGLGHDSLPHELFSGDLVQTFNEDKHLADNSIIVRLAEPARLYVLLDGRNAPPKWLSSRFTNTGLQVSQDADVDATAREMAGLPRPPTTTIKKYPFSIWETAVSDDLTVVLGSNDRGECSCGMYGIVVVPLGRTPEF